MNKRIITLCYRKIIRPNSLLPWDKMVHENSYLEFKMQAQNFTTGTNITSYAELLRQVPNAHQLPDRVAPAVTGYVQQLGGIIPDILNTLGRRFLHFNNFRFEIINSDISDSDKHVIAVNFFSEPLLWIDTVDNYLLVSAYQEKTGTLGDGEILTDLFQLQPYLNIHSLVSSKLYS
jgi:hypothetical protein